MEPQEKVKVRAYVPAEIEPRWRAAWDEAKLHRTGDDASRPKFYCLDFFPYPSGDGLSVGHCRNYVPTDVITRYQRMKGKNVLHPMGWDAFGLPAENKAIEEGVHPSVLTRKYTANYRRQLTLVGTSYDWEREIASTHPAFYKWTQWFFLLLHERGLAYRAKGSQWWCDGCQTILANEQVVNGTCWRHGTPVGKRDLEQWYFRITDYADRLLSDLDTVDWPERIKSMQRNWIGRSEGAEIRFKCESGDDIPVFTTRPDTLYGVTFVCLAPEHPLVDVLCAPGQRAMVSDYVAAARARTEIDRLGTGEARDKTGVALGAFAIHPLTGENVPLWVADYVVMGYGSGAVMAVPAHDQRDFEFARRFGLPVKQVIRPEGFADDKTGTEAWTAAYVEPGVMVHSNEFDGMPSVEGGRAVVAKLARQKLGKATKSYRLRDWLISRQRFWGAPIPMIHCGKCGTVPVPKADLPVLLPQNVDFRPRGTGRSPLANAEQWLRVSCPRCGGPAERETDTMDGFACSSWYFLRFTSPRYEEGPFDPAAMRYWMPVDLYVGGAEHAVMHLLYARFWTKVMHDAGLVAFTEPFAVLRNQGVLHAPDGARMSKSKGNVITPDSVVDRYGADTLRTYLCFMAPFEDDVVWSDQDISGAHRFLLKIWRLVLREPISLSPSPADLAGRTGPELELLRLVHRTVKRVSGDVERFHFNTAIARMMELVNALGTHAEAHGRTPVMGFALRTLLLCLAPIAPHVTEELWQASGETFSIHRNPWPSWDETLAAEDVVTLVAQVNGKVRDKLEAPRTIGEGGSDRRREGASEGGGLLARKTVVKAIYVPGRLVNLVVK
ncbi:MAG: leucine--tRNA ligase [Acidobacteriota bacterium]